jgi:hypothetical protein
VAIARIMLATIEKQMNSVFWWSMPRTYKQKHLLDRVKFVKR